MPDYPLDLGRPMNGQIAVTDKPSKKKEKFYPTLYLEWEKEYDFPASGEMVVRFKRVSETKRTNRDGKKSYNVELEIKSIEDVTEKASSEDKKSDRKETEDALDKLAEDYDE